MIDRIKKFVRDNDVEIAMTICVVGGFIIGAWTVNSAYKASVKGKAFLEIPPAAINAVRSGIETVVFNIPDVGNYMMSPVPK